MCTFMYNGRPGLPLFTLNHTELFLHLMNLKDYIIGTCAYLCIYIQLNNGTFSSFCVCNKKAGDNNGTGKKKGSIFQEYLDLSSFNSSIYCGVKCS